LATLYICATPIGNLSDISTRLQETLQNVDCIYGEDTRRVLKLLNHLNIKKPVFSYFIGNEHNKIGEIENLLHEGKNIALLSDAGTPLIADPGSELVSALVSKNIKIESIRFVGFIPKSGKDRLAFISNLITSNVTTVCFTSPKRLIKDLESFTKDKITNQIVVCRELTKKFETIYRGTAEELLKQFQDTNVKGEVTIVIEGQDKTSRLDLDVESVVQNLIKFDVPKREIAKTISSLTDISTNEIYEQIKDF
jgi:16S rRNA (cytidine1402-2'-O)-methyltransferase